MVRNSKILTVQEAKAIDREAQGLGLLTLVLMENAGRAVAKEALKVLKGRKAVVIFCGKGNNGGDGFAAARHLLIKGIKPEIFLAGKPLDVKNEAGVNLQVLLKLRQKVQSIREDNLHLVREKIQKNSLLIDALLGVGLQGEVRGIFRPLIEMINASRGYVLSVDIPSGLDADTGKVLGCCIKANKTVTFVAKKKGMTIGDGPKHCGKIIIADLGLPFNENRF